MPGHDKSRIVGLDQDQLEHFLCGICENVLNDPIVTQCCRQSYCRQCIEEWLKDGMICPNDNHAIEMGDSIQVPRFVVNFINELRIKCKSYKKGCDHVVNIENYDEHWENCKFRCCDICGCKDPDHQHVCLDHVITENIKLKEELNKCKDEMITQKIEITMLKTNIEINYLTARNFQEKLDLGINVDKNMSESQDDNKNDPDLVEKLRLTRISYEALNSKYENIRNENSTIKSRIKFLEQAYESLRCKRIRINACGQLYSENKLKSLHEKNDNITVCILFSI